MAPAPGLRPAVFLDRDGVLNRAVVRDRRPYPPASAAEVEILPGVAEACAGLSQDGFVLVVVTNQPDIARGRQSVEAVEEIHRALRAHLYVDAIYVCPHDDADGCPCRKPRPGLLLQAAAEHAIDLSASFMVGDRWRDVEAGRQAGCRTVFVDYDYDEARPQAADAVVGSLPEVTDWIRSTKVRTVEEQLA